MSLFSERISFGWYNVRYLLHLPFVWGSFAGLCFNINKNSMALSFIYMHTTQNIDIFAAKIALNAHHIQ